MQKVEGSSPFSRLEKARECGPLSFSIGVVAGYLPKPSPEGTYQPRRRSPSVPAKLTSSCGIPSAPVGTSARGFAVAKERDGDRHHRPHQRQEHRDGPDYAPG